MRIEFGLLLTEHIAIDAERKRLLANPYDSQAEEHFIERLQVHWIRVQAFGERLRFAIAAKFN
jgi:hypothetical protein